MFPLLALLIIATVSLLVIRIGALALLKTGLSRDVALFQAHSAFFGVGFTTREAELVVNHPVRRRIIRDLILAGNIGLTSALATAVITFGGTPKEGDPAAWVKVITIIAGLAALLLLSRSTAVSRLVDRTISAAMRRAGVLHPTDYDFVLRVKSGYSVAELELERSHPLVDRSLAETRLRARGIVVLGIVRSKGNYVGAPHGETVPRPNDVLILYGEDARLNEIINGRMPELRDRPSDHASNTTHEHPHASNPTPDSTARHDQDHDRRPHTPAATDPPPPTDD